RRPEIVADAGEQLRALLDVALDARAHVEEGERGAAYFACAADAERAAVLAATEFFHRVGEQFDWPHLVANEHHRDDAEKDGRAENPSDEQRAGARLHTVAIGGDL